MKKKNVLIRLVFVFLIVLIGPVFEESKSQVRVEVEVDVSEGSTYNYCRCHGESNCLGGNYISFRRSCAKSSEPLDCTGYNSNC